MRPLRFVALNEDGTHLVLAPDVPEAIDNGERFLVPVDERLRAAARGDMSRLGQIEIELESSLRPRDIQARIRAGETPEQVAAVAGVRLEKVMRYAHPVLLERQRMSEQARVARVRLADGTPAAALDEFMVEKLSLLDTDHRQASWDARRRPDGGWEILISWTVGNRHNVTRWWFDVAGRSVTPADAETSAFAERPRAGQSVIVAPHAGAFPRQLSVVGTDPPADQSAAETGPLHLSQEAAEGTDDTVDAGAAGSAGSDAAAGAGPNAAAGAGSAGAGSDAAAGAGSDDDRDHKPRIPSWEDIVFGVRRKRT